MGGNPLVTSIISQGNDLPAAEVLGTMATDMEEWKVLVQSTGTVSSPTSEMASGASTTAQVNSAWTTVAGTTKPPVRSSSMPSSR